MSQGGACQSQSISRWDEDGSWLQQLQCWLLPNSMTPLCGVKSFSLPLVPVHLAKRLPAFVLRCGDRRVAHSL